MIPPTAPNSEADAVLAKACGTTDGVVSIFRLQPGAQTLPRSGNTNGRLMLHFCIEGCQGVEITVGDDRVKSFGAEDATGGSALVYDDSFVNTMSNEGPDDVVILEVALAHPDRLHS